MIKYPDYKTIKKFIELLANLNGYYEIRYFQNEKKFRAFFNKDDSLPKRIARFIVRKEDANQYDWYIGIFPRNEKKGTMDVIDKCNYFFIDIDDCRYIKNLALLIQDVKEKFFEPYIVAVSGRGVHLYFKVEVLNPIEWRKYQKIVGEYFKKSYNAEYFIDTTRIARIIGTWNYKSNKPTFLSYYSNREIKIEELNDLLKLKDLPQSI